MEAALQNMDVSRDTYHPETNPEEAVTCSCCGLTVRDGVFVDIGRGNAEAAALLCLSCTHLLVAGLYRIL